MHFRHYLNVILGEMRVYPLHGEYFMSGIRTISAKDHAKFAGMRVLLVDDHPNIRSIITGIINALGIDSVTTAERGDVGLKTLSKGRFDVLITDDAMPGMTGIELARTVRNDARSSRPSVNFQIPIVMITGNVTYDRLNDARDSGIDEVLAKPFTVLGVADRLNSVVSKRREFIVSDAYVGPCRRRNSKAAYFGQLRRAADFPELPISEIEKELLLVRQEALSLCEIAQSSDVLGHNAHDVVIATALSVAQRAKRIRDPLLQRACRSLTKYVRWAATGASVEGRIVETHGQAMIELLELGVRDLHLSEQVAKGLEDTVSSRTARRAA